jgi:hypothetical protein
MAKKTESTLLDDATDQTEEITQPTPSREGLFRVEAKFNDDIHTAESDNLSEAIMSIQPKVLKTRVLFHIEKDGKQANLLIHRIPALQMFRNKLAMLVFTNRVILK